MWALGHGHHYACREGEKVNQCVNAIGDWSGICCWCCDEGAFCTALPLWPWPWGVESWVIYIYIIIIINTKPKVTVSFWNSLFMRIFCRVKIYRLGFVYWWIRWLGSRGEPGREGVTVIIDPYQALCVYGPLSKWPLSQWTVNFIEDITFPLKDACSCGWVR